MITCCRAEISAWAAQTWLNNHVITTCCVSIGFYPWAGLKLSPGENSPCNQPHRGHVHIHVATNNVKSEVKIRLNIDQHYLEWVGAMDEVITLIQCYLWQHEYCDLAPKSC